MLGIFRRILPSKVAKYNLYCRRLELVTTALCVITFGACIETDSAHIHVYFVYISSEACISVRPLIVFDDICIYVQICLCVNMHHTCMQECMHACVHAGMSACMGY